jgi:hypothetical protein
MTASGVVAQEFRNNNTATPAMEKTATIIIVRFSFTSNFQV